MAQRYRLFLTEAVAYRSDRRGGDQLPARPVRAGLAGPRRCWPGRVRWRVRCPRPLSGGAARAVPDRLGVRRSRRVRRRRLRRGNPALQRRGRALAGRLHLRAVRLPDVRLLGAALPRAVSPPRKSESAPAGTLDFDWRGGL